MRAVTSSPPRKCKDCPRPAKSRRHWYCEACGERHRRLRNQKARDKVPGKTAARGYDGAHQKKRDRWKDAIARGEVTCSRPECGKLIFPGEPWDLDHTDDRTGYLGPSHRSCNRRAGAIKGNQARGAVAPPARTERLAGW